MILQRHKPKSTKKIKYPYWPPASEGKPWGANPKQKLVWFENLSDRLKSTRVGHRHWWDITLCLGSTRSGKTQACIARALMVARQNPGARICVGSINFAHLEETVIEDYKRLLSNKKAWDHPSIRRSPNRAHKKIVFHNGSVIHFVNLENSLRNLGKEFDLIHIEEAELLKDSSSLEVLLTRLSSPVWKYKQIILTANPIGDNGLDWLIDWFKLEQLEEGYKGEYKPIGKPCRCQYCPRCSDEEKKVDVPFATNDCCKKCGYKKLTDCPGGQYFQRVLYFHWSDNRHLGDDYGVNLNATLSYDKKVQLSKGFVLHRRAGKIYTCFDGGSVLGAERDIDPNYPLIWSLDFNQRPQCSVICQEFRDSDGIQKARALDELVKYDAGPEQVAEEFLLKFGHLPLKELRIFGDPSAFNGAIENIKLDTYHAIVSIIEKRLPRTKIILRARKTKFSISSRINSVNWMFKDGNGLRRLFVSPRCRHLIISLEKCEWDKSGKDIDDKCDEKARQKAKQSDPPWMLTHPADALGYYIIEDHPMIPHVSSAVPFIHNPMTGTIAELREGQIFETKIDKDQEYLRIVKQLKEEDDDEDEELDFEDDRELSIAGSLTKECMRIT